MSANELARTKTPLEEFAERIGDRLRKDFGELLPNEVLSGLVQRAIEDNFFKTRKVPVNSWTTQELPSLFIEEVARLAKPKIDSAIDAYLAAHPDVIDRTIAQFLDQNSLAVMVSDRLATKLQLTFDNFLSQLQNR